MVAEYDLQALINDAENITKLILHDAFRRGFPKTQIDSQLQKLDQLKKSIKRIKSQVNEDYDYLSKSDLKIKEFALGREEIDKYVQTLDIFRPSINFDDSELDNIKYQVTAILKMSIREAELERKLAELSAAVQLDRGDAKLINDLTELIGVHDRQVGQIEEQKREIKQKNDNLDAATAAYQREVLRLITEHDNEIKNMSRELADGYDRIKELSIQSEQRESDFKDFEAKSREEKEALEQKYQAEISELQSTHAAQLLALEQTHNNEMNERDAQIAANNSALESKHRDDMKMLQNAHDAKLQEMKREFANEFEIFRTQRKLPPWASRL